MQEQFAWRLHPSEEELDRLWEGAVFAFDANVLLNLYRVSESTTQDILEAIRALGERIYLPHRAAEEFFSNRRSVIRRQKEALGSARSKIEEWKNKTRDLSSLRSELGEAGQIMSNELDFLFGEEEDPLDGKAGFTQSVDAIAEELLRRIEKLEETFSPSGSPDPTPESDPILRQLLDQFEGHTGLPLIQKVSSDGGTGVVEKHTQIPNDVRKEAQKRYEHNIPPGYEDADKEGADRYGDYIVWKEILQYAETAETAVVFVTSDRKPDWWAMNQGDIFGPRPELRREFSRETGNQFWMYSLTDFLSESSERFGIAVKEKSLTQAEEVAEESDDGFPWGKLLEGISAGTMSFLGVSAITSLGEVRDDVQAAITEGDVQALPEMTDALANCLATMDATCRDDRFSDYSREARRLSRKIGRDVEHGWPSRAEENARRIISVANGAIQKYNSSEEEHLLMQDLKDFNESMSQSSGD